MIPPSQNPILLFIPTYSNLNSSFDDNFSLPIRLLSPIFFSFLFSFLFLSFHSFDPRLKSLPIFHSIDLKATRIFASFPRSEVFSLINGYEIPNCGHILSGMELSTKMRLLATQLESRLVSHTRYISLSLLHASIVPDLASLLSLSWSTSFSLFPPNLFLELGIFGNLSSYLARGIDFKLILIYWNEGAWKFAGKLFYPNLSPPLFIADDLSNI